MTLNNVYLLLRPPLLRLALIGLDLRLGLGLGLGLGLAIIGLRLGLGFGLGLDLIGTALIALGLIGCDRRPGRELGRLLIFMSFIESFLPKCEFLSERNNKFLTKMF